MNRTTFPRLPRLHRTAIAGIAVAGVAAVGLAVPALADDDPSGTSIVATEPDGELDGLRDELRDQRRADFAERLAEELGLDADEVAAALESVTEELRQEQEARRLELLALRLDQAVEDGLMTREQAEALLEAAEERDGFPGPGGHHGFGLGPGAPGGHGGGLLDGPGSDVAPEDGATEPSST